MTATMKALQIDRLSADERLSLMHEIWDSLAAESGQEYLTDAQRRELERRLAEHQADPDDVTPWDEIRMEALARFQS